MKKTNLRLLVVLAGIFVSTAAAYAQLTLTIDSYTTDELSFTISGTFSATTIGDAPGILAIKNDWFNNQGTHTELFSGTPTFVSSIMIGGATATGALASGSTPAADSLSWSNPSGGSGTAITIGTAVTGTATITGVGQFDPTTNNALQLVSGFNGVSSTPSSDWVRLEANGIVVPEPSTYALIIGGACLGFVVWKRRRQAKELVEQPRN